MVGQHSTQLLLCRESKALRYSCHGLPVDVIDCARGRSSSRLRRKELTNTAKPKTMCQRDPPWPAAVCRRGPKRRKKDKRGSSSKPAGKRKTRGMVAEKRRPRNFAALLEEVRS